VHEAHIEKMAVRAKIIKTIDSIIDYSSLLRFTIIHNCNPSAIVPAKKKPRKVAFYREQVKKNFKPYF